MEVEVVSTVLVPAELTSTLDKVVVPKPPEDGVTSTSTMVVSVTTVTGLAATSEDLEAEERLALILVGIIENVKSTDTITLPLEEVASATVVVGVEASKLATVFSTEEVVVA